MKTAIHLQQISKNQALLKMPDVLLIDELLPGHDADAQKVFVCRREPLSSGESAGGEK